jgi:hypothetical protein
LASDDEAMTRVEVHTRAAIGRRARQAKCRTMKRAGVMVCRVELDWRSLDMLVRVGVVPASVADAADASEIGRALSAWIRNAS